MESLDLRELLSMLKKWVWLILLVMVLSTSVSLYLSIHVIEPQYEAETKLLVNKKQADQISLADITLSTQLINTYDQIIESDSVAEAVIQKLNLNVTVDKLNSYIKVSSQQDSQVMSLMVTYPDPHMAVKMANTIAQTFMEQVGNLMGTQNVSIINRAMDMPNPVPISPNKTKNTLLAAIFGVIGASVLIMLIEFLDTSIKRNEDLEHIYNLPVLCTMALIKDVKRSRMMRTYRVITETITLETAGTESFPNETETIQLKAIETAGQENPEL